MTGNRKACPLCKSTDISIVSFGDDRVCAICNVCECSTGYMLDNSEAEEAWDTRPIEDAQAAEITELNEELERLQNALYKERSAANDLLANIGKWAYRTAGQTMPIAISDAIFDFELQRISCYRRDR